MRKSQTLKAFLARPPHYWRGARAFLGQRFGVFPRTPFIPVQVFGFVVDEGANDVRPARVERGAELTGG